MKIKQTKKSRPLPGRGALNDLENTTRTINDYSKATPVNIAQSTPSILQGLRKQR